MHNFDGIVFCSLIRFHFVLFLLYLRRSGLEYFAFCGTKGNRETLYAIARMGNKTATRLDRPPVQGAAPAGPRGHTRSIETWSNV